MRATSCVSLGTLTIIMSPLAPAIMQRLQIVFDRCATFRADKCRLFVRGWVSFTAKVPIKKESSDQDPANKESYDYA